MSARTGGARRPWVLLLWLVLAVGCMAIAGPRVALPGLYYDEAFMAQQARDFLEPERVPEHAASTRELWIQGRPFPLRNAVYLGSLKSQLLIPSFALFGATPEVLRLTTLGWSLLALLCVMLWTERILGTPAALLTGGLIATDPSYYFFSLYEWGPFTTGLLCRAAGLLLVTAGWRGRSRTALVAGAFALGLGVYSRVDFAVVLVATALGLALCRPALIREAFVERRRELGIAGLAAACGAAPMLISVADLWVTSRSSAFESRGDLAEKLRVYWSMLEGSRFYRVIDAGGVFDRMFERDAPRSGFGFAFAACAGLAAWEMIRRRRSPFGVPAFLLVTSLVVTFGMWMIPGAVRTHHLLNLLPFAHILVASVCVEAWSRPRGPLTRRLLRAGLSLSLGALLAGNLWVIARTYGLIEATGGRGWWSDALSVFAAETDERGGPRVTSLDWGLHEPLFFLTRTTRPTQPIWRIPEAERRRGAWSQRGAATDLYILHEPEYDLFRFGPAFLRAVSELAVSQPDVVEIRRHRDRQGEVAFTSVRLDRPHLVSYRRGRFEIQLQ